MNHQTSKLGKLIYKFEHTGCAGHPVITNKELINLSDRLFEAAYEMMDIECIPVALYFRQFRQSVESMIRARKE